MSRNSTTLADEDNDYPDWVELYNTTDKAISLQGYALSDGYNQNNYWKLPPLKLERGDYLVVFLSGKDRKEGELHTDFKLSSDEEPLIIYGPHGKPIDIFRPKPTIMEDVSCGRVEDGQALFAFFSDPTPGTTNASKTVVKNIVVPSKPPGFYTDAFDLELNVANGDTIYYTLDGSEPTPKSLQYKKPLHIKDQTEQPNKLSAIPTNPQEGPDRIQEYIWKPPKENVFKGTVVKAQSFNSGKPTSEIAVFSYFVREHLYSFPVVSLVTPAENFFNHEKGIYVPGKVFADEGWENTWWPAGNYQQTGMEWERPVHVSFFEPNGKQGFACRAGIRTHGAVVSGMPVKSLRLCFRNDYGIPQLNYPVFPGHKTNRFKRLILRNSGNDFSSTMFRDAFIQHLAKDMHLETQAYRPAIVFLNGEYWGIHNIREKFDEHYFLNNYPDISENELNMVAGCSEEVFGSDSTYKAMRKKVAKADMAMAENYDLLAAEMDMENFIDYYLLQTYIANSDWPGNNVKLWRKNEDKWKYMLFDLDCSFALKIGIVNTKFNQVGYNSIEFATMPNSKEWYNNPCSTMLFRKMLQNPTFQQQFICRYNELQAGVLNPDSVVATLDYFTKLYEPEIEEHIRRWNYPTSKEAWLKDIKNMRDFAENRPEFYSKYLEEYLGKEVTCRQTN